jgi:hypothetical protein
VLVKYSTMEFMKIMVLKDQWLGETSLVGTSGVPVHMSWYCWGWHRHVQIYWAVVTTM